MDIAVSDANGKFLKFIETKVGGSKYHILQRMKDNWLKNLGYDVDLYRLK